MLSGRRRYVRSRTSQHDVTISTTIIIITTTINILKSYRVYIMYCRRANAILMTLRPTPRIRLESARGSLSPDGTTAADTLYIRHTRDEKKSYLIKWYERRSRRRRRRRRGLVWKFFRRPIHRARSILRPCHCFRLGRARVSYVPYGRAVRVGRRRDVYVEHNRPCLVFPSDRRPWNGRKVARIVSVVW